LPLKQVWELHSADWGQKCGDCRISGAESRVLGSNVMCTKHLIFRELNKLEIRLEFNLKIISNYHLWHFTRSVQKFSTNLQQNSA